MHGVLFQILIFVSLLDCVTEHLSYVFILWHPNVYMKISTAHECFDRNPIPDYYSITLEISRDRTTAAQDTVCHPKDASAPKCPLGHKDGERFLYRTLNEACQKMVSYLFNKW